MPTHHQISESWNVIGPIIKLKANVTGEPAAGDFVEHTSAPTDRSPITARSYLPHVDRLMPAKVQRSSPYYRRRNTIKGLNEMSWLDPNNKQVLM